MGVRVHYDSRPEYRRIQGRTATIPMRSRAGHGTQELGIRNYELGIGLITASEQAAAVDPERRVAALAVDPDRDGAAAAVALEQRVDDLQKEALESGLRVRDLRVHEERALEVEGFGAQVVDPGQ